MNNIYCIRHGWSDHNEAFLKSDYDEKVFESKKYKKSRLTEHLSKEFFILIHLFS